jgi:carboxylesterase
MPDRRDPFSAPGGPTGALVLHGFTGTPSAMRSLAETIALAGFAVELPLLPGHATTPVDLGTKSFSDFAGAVEDAYEVLAERTTAIVVVGLSMGGTLALDLATRHHELAGVVLINPLAEPPAPSFLELLRAAHAGGSFSFPSIGSDIAKPGDYEGGYEETPIAPLISTMEGVADLGSRLSEITSPVLMFTSRTDHVVPPTTGDFLEVVITSPIERVMLEQSHHVATLDYDAELIARATIEFLQKVVVPL